jgi:ferredoxin
MKAGKSQELPRAERVWIDQDLCTGDGLCVELAPEVFELDIDGIAYVKGENGQLAREPGHQVELPAQLRAAARAAAADCPGSCIYLVTPAPASGND